MVDIEGSCSVDLNGDGPTPEPLGAGGTGSWSSEVIGRLRETSVGLMVTAGRPRWC